MRSNTRAAVAERTYEGAPAAVRSPDQLERLVATCMLFENTFYEKGDAQAQNIADECAKADPREIAAMAIKARTVFKLRHVPLFLLVQLNKRRAECSKFPSLIRETVANVIRRPDEAGELLKLISNDSKVPLKKAMSHAVEKGLAAALVKFNEYQLAKWNRDSQIKLRDVIFLTHAKPKGEGSAVRLEKQYKTGRGTPLRHSEGQAATFTKLINGTLEPPDTWEVALSSGKDKKETWERLLSEKKLGFMALLMNLRNMVDAKVDRMVVEKAILAGAPKSHALPFRFLTAERHAPAFSGVLSDAMLSAVADQKGSLPGDTAIVVDVSGSMDDRLSAKSELSRLRAAAALAILAKEVCESSTVWSFSNELVEVRNMRGIPLVLAIENSQRHGGTNLGAALNVLFDKAKHRPGRVIVITDEQSSSAIPQPPKDGWIINVAGYKPALQVSGRWRRLSGFSERILDFVKYEEGLPIAETETE